MFATLLDEQRLVQVSFPSLFCFFFLTCLCRNFKLRNHHGRAVSKQIVLSYIRMEAALLHVDILTCCEGFQLSQTRLAALAVQPHGKDTNCHDVMWHVAEHHLDVIDM